MDKFTKLTGVAAPLPRVNVDTDAIIPKQYLKTIKRTGLKAGLFYEWRTNPDGSISMDKPPVLMGVIFLLAGVGICFLSPSGGTPHWIVYAAGGMFGACGVFILLYQLENKAYSKIAQFIMLALFLAIFHWVSFGSGERIGTSSTPFSTHSGVNVRWPFAIFTGVLDLIIIGSAIRWLVKRTKD